LGVRNELEQTQNPCSGLFPSQEAVGQPQQDRMAQKSKTEKINVK